LALKYRKDIQALRGLAVLAVVLFHAKESYFPLGYLGVDVFFVISGFVVTPLILRIFSGQTTWAGRFSNLRYFYKRRFFRLAPAMAVTLLASVFTILFLGPTSDHERFAKQGIATLLLQGNLGAYRYSGDYFSPNPNPLVHTWSLSVEEQIYLILPLIFMLILGNRKSHKKTASIVFAFITAISFAFFLSPEILEPLYSRTGIQLASEFHFYSSIERVWQFTIGSMGYLLLSRFQNSIGKIPKILNLVLSITLCLVLFGPLSLNLKNSSILASSFALIILFGKSLDSLPHFLGHRLAWFGDRSYSIYLVHMPLLYIAKYSPATVIGNSENRTIQSVIAVLLAIILGAWSYTKIENVYRSESKSKKYGPRSILVTGLITFLIPIALFSIMKEGPENQYWGLDRNSLQPKYAALLDGNCTRDFFYTKSGGLKANHLPCIYTFNGAKKTVLLLGDSHAGMLSQAVVDSAKNQKWNAVIATMGGCNVQYSQSVSGQVSEKCLDFNLQMRKWILKHKPNAIIVSQFVYANSLNQKDRRDPLVTQIDLKKALLQIRSVTPYILLVENNPMFPDEKEFMVSRALIMRPYKAPMTFPRSQMQVRDKEASNMLAKWAGINDIFTINLESLFCNNNSCSRYSKAGWLYRDDDHLSVAGANLVIPEFEKYLKQI
jgi:peptidoglycan/LPS O-acetylase OafA/YrhL